MTSISQQAVREALLLAQSGGEPALQPAILMHRNIDHDNVGEYAQCYVNDSWAPALKKLIDDGFVVFRIQTELDINGHVTYAYLAKMKTN